MTIFALPSDTAINYALYKLYSLKTLRTLKFTIDLVNFTLTIGPLLSLNRTNNSEEFLEMLIILETKTAVLLELMETYLLMTGLIYHKTSWTSLKKRKTSWLNLAVTKQSTCLMINSFALNQKMENRVKPLMIKM